MSKILVLVALLVLVFPFKLLAMGEEDFGDKPLSDANYKDFPGIMPLLNQPGRVYRVWINGNELFYYKGDTAAVNSALETFAASKQDVHEVVLRPGPGVTHPMIEKKEIPFDWNVHIVGGIAKVMNRDDLGSKVWNRWPMITVYFDPDARPANIDLAAIKIPAGIKFLELSDLSSRYREALASKTQDVRGWTCGELAELDPYDAASRDAVARMLEDPVPWVRTNAALALSRFADAKATLPALRDALKNAAGDAQLKETIEKSIATIEKSPAEDAAAAEKHRAAVKAIHDFVAKTRVAGSGRRWDSCA
jgi:HEAT repeats